MTILKVKATKRAFIDSSLDLNILGVVSSDKFEKTMRKAYEKHPDDGLWKTQKKRNKYILKKLLK